MGIWARGHQGPITLKSDKLLLLSSKNLDKLKNDRQYDQVLNFATPQDKLFFDFYTNGTLKKLCGDNYIYSTKATAAATPTPTNTYVGGVVDK